MTKTSWAQIKLNDRKESVLLLRFRTLTPNLNDIKYMSYARIVKLVCLTYNQVQHICRQAMKKKKRPDISRHLDQVHIDFLKDARNLELWSGKTVKERCTLFHRRFPAKRLAPTTLRRLYLLHKIKRKKVRQEKFLPRHIRDDYAQRCQNLLREL